jgi:PAS domain S-box-containing protein
VATRTRKSSEQKAAESAVEGFRRYLGPFAVAAETTRLAKVFTDARGSDNPIVFANDSFLSLSGYGREDVLGQKFRFMISTPVDPEVLAQLDAAFEGRSTSHLEICFRRKGEAASRR